MMRAALRDPRWYLAAGVLGIVLLLLLGAVVPDVSIGSTYLVDLVAIVTLGAMVVLWAMCRPVASLSASQRVFLAAGFAAWIICAVEFLATGSVTQPALLLSGALLGLPLLRPPDGDGAAWLVDLLALGVAAVCLVVLALEAAGLRDSWYGQIGLMDLAASERQLYWIPLVDLFGLDGRWSGPFDHPGRSGQVGALLLVWGATRRGWIRPVLVACGALFVVLAGSNTAYLSLAVGAAVLAVVAVLRRAGQLPRWVTVVITGGAIAAVLGLLVVVVGPNTGLTGRTSIWPTYLDLWRGSPWTGIGATGIATAQQEGLLPSWAYHAHDSWLDLLARHGLIVLLASVISIAGAVVATVRSARAGVLGPLGVLVVLLVASITQPMIVWLLPTIPMTMMLLAVLASDRPARPGQRNESGQMSA